MASLHRRLLQVLALGVALRVVCWLVVPAIPTLIVLLVLVVVLRVIAGR